MTLLVNTSVIGLMAAQDAKVPAVYGPRLYFHARFWNTPGWQPRERDYAYLQVTPGPNTAAVIQRTLQDIPAQYRLVHSTAIAGMEGILHELIEVKGFKLACLGYDVEGWELTPETEKGDPVTACKKGQALAHKYGLKFLVGPTRQLGERFGVQMAQFADLMKVQHKGGQAANVDTAIAQQRELYVKLRAANPKVLLYHDMATVPKGKPQTLAQLLRYYRGMADLVDGIGIWSLESHRQHLEPFLRAIRPPIGSGQAFAPNEGPRMYFFAFHWNAPGWTPRAGDYACSKVTPRLKTLADKTGHIMDSLRDIPAKYRMVHFNALGGADEVLRDLIEVQHFPVSCLGYDLEEWELTPATERADPVEACRQGQALADKYGLDFIVTPSQAMAAKWGARIAPLVKAIKPQCKGTQVRNIDEAIARQRKLCTEIRLANPDIQLFHDVGLRPKGVLQKADDLLRYYAGVADLVDGIGVFSQDSPDERCLMEKYILGVRPPMPHP